MSENLLYLRLTIEKLLLFKVAKVTNVPMPLDEWLSNFFASFHGHSEICSKMTWYIELEYNLLYILLLRSCA